MPLDRLEVARPTPAAPAAARGVKAAGGQAPAPKVGVDVAKFRIMPLAGAPQVAASVDETLGKTGLFPFLLGKVEAFGDMGLRIANGLRFFTRVVGPIAYGFSAFWNIKLLGQAMKDDSLNASSKATLAVGTVGATVGAVAAAIAALPGRLLGMVGLGTSHQILANKASGIAGGIAGVGFAAINLVETLRNPKALEGEKLFAKLGFGIGLVGFVAGTTALVLSTGAMGGLIGLLPIASKIATVAGITGLASWIAQLALGKNQWLHAKLGGAKPA